MVADVAAPPWPIVSADAIYTANLLHISPPACISGLMRGAGQHLRSAGTLFVYGPFRIDGVFSSDGDARFDESPPRAGTLPGAFRDLETLVSAAAEQGLALVERLPMPANNWLLSFRAAAR